MAYLVTHDLLNDFIPLVFSIFSFKFVLYVATFVLGAASSKVMAYVVQVSRITVC